MPAQSELFGDLQNPVCAMPQGFRYEEEILSEAEEAALVESLSRLELAPFQLYGHSANRRVISFGLRYAYERRALEAADGFPPFLAELRNKAAAFAGRKVEEFRQGGINEYPPGAGIGWHTDKPQFGMIVGVSLSAPAILRLRLRTGRNWMRKSQRLEPRSIYVLEGEARRRWEHSIAPVDLLRHAVIFRTLA